MTLQSLAILIAGMAADVSATLWALLVFELWHREFVDAGEPEGQGL